MTNTWIIPASVKYYDIEKQYAENDEIEWTQRNNFYVGDIVYIYLTSPIKEIRYKCVVTAIDIYKNNREYNDDKYYIGLKTREGQRFVRLKYIDKFNDGDITLSKIREFGIKCNFQSAFRAKGEFLNFLNSYNAQY